MNYRKILLSTAILAFSFHHAQNLKLNPTSAEERWKGYEQRKKLEENSILKNLEFRNVGPTTMSGRVTDIDDPYADFIFISSYKEVRGE